MNWSCKGKYFAFFHTLTGCDTTSAFAGRGKKTAWDIWNILLKDCANASEQALAVRLFVHVQDIAIDKIFSELLSLSMFVIYS